MVGLVLTCSYAYVMFFGIINARDIYSARKAWDVVGGEEGKIISGQINGDLSQRVA